MLLFEVLLLRGQALQRFADMVFGHFDHMAGEFEAGMVGKIEARDHLEGHGEGKVALAVDNGVHFGFVFRQLHFRLVGGLEVALGQEFLALSSMAFCTTSAMADLP